jgi:hypothetical protein
MQKKKNLCLIFNLKIFFKNLFKKIINVNVEKLKIYFY